MGKLVSINGKEIRPTTDSGPPPAPGSAAAFFHEAAAVALSRLDDPEQTAGALALWRDVALQSQVLRDVLRLRSGDEWHDLLVGQAGADDARLALLLVAGVHERLVHASGMQGDQQQRVEDRARTLRAWAELPDWPTMDAADDLRVNDADCSLQARQRACLLWATVASNLASLTAQRGPGPLPLLVWVAGESALLLADEVPVQVPSPDPNGATQQFAASEG